MSELRQIVENSKLSDIQKFCRISGIFRKNFKKASTDRQHATSAMNDKIQATIQAALAAVQAHNAGVTATVQSENQKVMQMLKSAQSMAAKVAAKKRDRQQNQNQSAVA